MNMGYGRDSLLRSDGAVRGLATGADIMCGTSPKKENSPEREDLQPTVSARPEEPKVAAMPAPDSSQQKWWRPDPVTGRWVPEGHEGHEGQVTTSTHVMKSPPRLPRIRSEPAASPEDKRWWTSMEELPDMDRANPK